MIKQNPITEAINHVGLINLARAVGVTYQMVRKWESAGRLPRTDWTGETNYSAIIQKSTGGLVTRKELLNKDQFKTA